MRAQLACTAKRLPGGVALPILERLMAHGEDVADPHLPMLIWWALEDKAVTDQAGIMKLFASPKTWRQPKLGCRCCDWLWLEKRIATWTTRKSLAAEFPLRSIPYEITRDGFRKHNCSFSSVRTKLPICRSGGKRANLPRWRRLE